MVEYEVIPYLSKDFRSQQYYFNGPSSTDLRMPWIHWTGRVYIGVLRWKRVHRSRASKKG